MDNFKKNYYLTFEKDDEINNKRKLEIKLIGRVIEDSSLLKEEVKTKNIKIINNYTVSSKKINKNKNCYNKIIIGQKNKIEKNKKKITHKTITKKIKRNGNENIDYDKDNIHTIGSIIGSNDSSYLFNSCLNVNSNDKSRIEKSNIENKNLSVRLDKYIYKRKSVGKGKRSFFKKNNSFIYGENAKIIDKIIKSVEN